MDSKPLGFTTVSWLGPHTLSVTLVRRTLRFGPSWSSRVPFGLLRPSLSELDLPGLVPGQKDGFAAPVSADLDPTMDRTAGWTPVKNCPENVATAPSPSGMRYQQVRQHLGTSISSEPQPHLPSCPSTPAAASVDFQFDSPQMAEDTAPPRGVMITSTSLTWPPIPPLPSSHRSCRLECSTVPRAGRVIPSPSARLTSRQGGEGGGGHASDYAPSDYAPAGIRSRPLRLPHQVSEGFSSRQSSPDRPSHQVQSSAQPSVSTIQPFASPAQPLSIPAQPLSTLTQPSYASAIRRPSASIQDPSSPQAAHLPPSADHRWDLAEELTPNEANRSQRTQTIWRADYGTTPSSLVAQLITQFPGHSKESLLDCVSRDVNEYCRFYIVYRDLAAKRRLAGAGFKLGSLTIKPESDYTEAFIPYPPHFCDEVHASSPLTLWDGQVRQLSADAGGHENWRIHLCHRTTSGQGPPGVNLVPRGGIPREAKGRPPVLLLLLPLWPYRGGVPDQEGGHGGSSGGEGGPPPPTTTTATVRAGRTPPAAADSTGAATTSGPTFSATRAAPPPTTTPTTATTPPTATGATAAAGSPAGAE